MDWKNLLALVLAVRRKWQSIKKIKVYFFHRFLRVTVIQALPFMQILCFAKVDACDHKHQKIGYTVDAKYTTIEVRDDYGCINICCTMDKRRGYGSPIVTLQL